MTSDPYEALARANPQEAKRLRDELRQRGDHRTADKLELGLRRAGWQPGRPSGIPGVTERAVSLDPYGIRRVIVRDLEPGGDSFAWARPFVRDGLSGRLDYGLARQAAADEHARREGRPITRTQTVQVPLGARIEIVKD